MKLYICAVLSAVICTVCISVFAAVRGGSAGGIINGDFSDNLNGWTITGSAEVSTEGGMLVLSGSDYDVKISQTAERIENGIYNLTADISSTDISGICFIYAKSAGRTTAMTAVPLSADMQKITVPGVIVDNGKCEIGLYIENSSSDVKLDNVAFSEAEKTRLPFLKGGEISKLTYIEDKGGKFYRADGTEGDALQIMAENGFNLARIRLLNDPGPGHGNGTHYLPAGYQTVEDCLSLAGRAKDKGMKIEFTFAYSDWWSDGGEQFPPSGWTEGASGLSGDALADYYADKIYSCTKEVLEKLVLQGTPPEFISIGNEMQYGMCFGDWQNNNGLYDNSEYLVRLANAGSRAAREVCPDAKIILHTDNGGKVASTRSVFIESLDSIDFDVIGVSYYPFYNEDVSIDTVVSEFDGFISRYDKDVIIMETGYNWTEKRGDGYEGQLENNGIYQDSYKETPEGQRAFLTELYAKLKQVSGGRCIGDMYWDPIMIYDGGSYKIGWAVKESNNWADGNVVSNSTIFDFNGKALDGQKAMKYNTNATDNILITGKLTDARNKAAANTAITVTVNGAKYNTSTDKFGEYIVSVPYLSEDIEISVKGCSGSQKITLPEYDVIIRDMNFAGFKSGTQQDQPEPPPAPRPVPTFKPTPTPSSTPTPTPEISNTPVPAETNKPGDHIVFVSGYSDPDGILHFETDYEADSGTAVIYVAAYDKNGRMIGCSMRKSGIFAADSSAAPYMLKAFLWDKDGITPLCEAKKIIIDGVD